ncbi:MAG: thioredoxin family protein [Flavobacterium sp.]
MKKLFITLLLVVSSMTIQAQEKLTWHTNIDEAIAVSKIENKPLFLFFTGSDWCGWCIRLQNEVFKTPEFIAWAKEKVVLVELDFPRRTPQSDALKIQNSQLQQFFQVRGYPNVRIVKAGAPIDGKTSFEQLGETGYLAGGPTVWLDGANKMVDKFVPYTAEEQKAAKKAAKKKKSTKKKS